MACGVPLVLVTGYDAAAAAPELAGVPCLQKPVHRRAMIETVRALCEGRG